jgi:hypothetical protein
MESKRDDDDDGESNERFDDVDDAKDVGAKESGGGGRRASTRRAYTVEEQEAKWGTLDDETVDLPEDVNAFMKFSMSEELASVSRKYVEEHYKMFSSAEEYRASGAGFPLAWTNLHAEFCEEIDEAISKFCDRRDLKVETLFENLQDSLSKSVVMSDYIPQFLKMFMEFDSFVDQMLGQNALDQLTTAALDDAPQEDEGWSGIWEVMHKYSKKAHDAFLEDIQVPWIMRKTYTTLLNNKKIKAVVTHEIGVKFTKTFSLGMAGSKTENIMLDGEWHRQKAGEQIRSKASMSKDGLTLTNWLQRCNDEDLTIPENADRIVANVFELRDDGRIMFCSEYVCHPDEPTVPTGPLFTYEAHRVDEN